MSKVPHIVDGEASESESELEIGKRVVESSHSPESCIVLGEASESDEELPIKEENVLPPVEIPQIPSKQFNFDSLLHQKLWESNVSLRATLEGLMKHTTDLATEKLGRADKTLLSVQESMRSTNACLTLAKARLKQIDTSLLNMNCTTALPTVKY